MDNTDPGAIPSLEKENVMQPSGEEVSGRIIINYCLVRILHAGVKQPPIRVMIGNRMIANHLYYGKISQYERVNGGKALVTIYCGMKTEMEIYQAEVSFDPGRSITLAITSTDSNVDIGVIYDERCMQQSWAQSCLRMVNLTWEKNVYDVLLSNGRIVFCNVQPREVTAWKYTVAGEYDFYLVPTPKGACMQEESESLLEMPYAEAEVYKDSEAVLMFYQRLLSDARYTCFVIGGYSNKTPIQIVIAEN